MVKMCTRSGLLIASGLLWAAQASAGVSWNEETQGDFSGNGLQPTSIFVAEGSNIVLGRTGDAGQGVDRDYFTFTVPNATSLSGIFLLPNATVSGSASFIGLQSGPQLTVLPSGAGSQNLIGYVHYGNDSVGTDLLPLISFAGTLGAGTYSVWVQEIGGPTEYGFDFRISAVPEPASAALAAAGVLVVGVARRNRLRCTSVQ